MDLSREFLNSNGAERHADVHVLPGTVWQPQWAGSTFAEKLENLVGDLNVCSQKGWASGLTPPSALPPC